MRALSRGVGTLVAATLAVVGLVVPAQAVTGMLPFAVTNSSGLSGKTYLYVMARDQASGVQGWVDGAGTWHAFDLPDEVPDGTPPPAAPDTAIAGPANGTTTTLHLRAGLVSGRIYMSFENKLDFFLAPEGLVEPAGWVETDPNHNTLFDWVEFARDGSRFFINTTMVDMFSVPISVSVVHGDGRPETQGRLVTNGRNRIFDDLKAYGWGDLIQYRDGGQLPLRAMAPVHGVEDGSISAGYFSSYVNDAWTYYSSTPLTVTTALGTFTGKVSGGKFVFTDAAGALVGTFSKPSTTDLLACEGATQPGGQPQHDAALAVGARLCAAFNRGTLSTPGHKRSDVQATHDAASFYPPGIASNLYSKAMHRSEANGNAYGFAFDDVAEFSPSINSENPKIANMTVTPFTGGAGAGGTGKPVTASVEKLFGHWTYGGYSDDPVNVATGNFTQAEPVIDFPVPWSPNLALTYNSRDTRAGPFGSGWSSSLTESVTENDDGSASVRWPDGSTVDYAVGQDDGYVTPQGIDATLTRTSAGWTTSRPDGSGESFDNAGRVLSFRDPDGRVVTVTRAWSGQVQTINGAGGYALTLASSGDGRITSATSSDGRTATLTYDGDRLVGITDPAGGTRTFGYDDAGHLASITDADGTRVVDNRYDADGRVLEQSRPGQTTEVFEYDDEHGTTRIVDPEGALVVAYAFDEDGRLTAMTAADGTTTTRTYDAGGRPAESTDRAGALTTTTWTTTGQVASVTSNGATTTYEYDDAARPTKVTGPTGETVTYSYDGAGRLPTGASLPDGSAVAFEASGTRLAALTDADGRTSRYTYDPQGNVATVTSPGGSVTSYGRDEAGRVTTTTAPDGGVTLVEYDAAGRVVSRTDPSGAVTRTTYTAAGRVATLTDPDGLRLTYAYDEAGRVSRVEGPDGDVTRYSYDARGDLARAVDPLGVETTYTNDLFGRVASSTRDGVTTTYSYDADGRRTAVETGGQSVSLQYDDAGRVIGSTDADGNMTRFGYDPLGRLLTTVAPDGTTTTSTYDANGNEVSRRDPMGRTSTATYSSAGLLTSSTDPMGYTTRYAYDEDGRLATTTTPGNHVYAYAYDAAGRPTSVTTPAGLVTRYGYDAAGRRTSVTSPGSGTVTTELSDAGRPTSVTDAGGSTATSTWDDAGRMASSTDAAGGRTTYAYDDAGHLTARTDPRGGVTRYTWTDGGHVATATDPLDRTTSYRYDTRGNVVRVESPDGDVTTYAYDRVGRLVGRTDPSGAKARWTYDVTGRRTSMTDATGTTRYTYDPTGQLTSITGPDGDPPFTFTYDGDGRVATTTYPDGTIVTVGRDPDGNVAAVTDNRGSYLAYSVDADGRVTREGSSAGAVRTFTYLDGLLSRYTEQLGAQAPTVSTGVERDANGRVTGLSTGGAVTSFGYDAAGQLTSVDGPGDDDRTYTYDAAGNRATTTAGGTVDTYSYDDANELTRVERGDDTWSTSTYDGSGRLTERSVADGSSWKVDYDGSGAPTRLAVDGTVATLTRDGDGRPVTVDWSTGGDDPATGSVDLGWLTSPDGLPTVASLDDGTATTDLYRGVGGALLQTSTDTVVADVSRDVLGSVLGNDVLGLLDGGYDEFGAPSDPAGAPVVGLGYRGQLTVAGIPLMGARAYDPSTGRFTATDPLPPVPGLAATSTPYPYVNNDPLDLIDPLGLSSVGDAAWGFADALTLGGTRYARQHEWGWLTDHVDYTSGAYKGGMIAGAVTGTLVVTYFTAGTGTALVAGAYSGAIAANAMPAVLQNRQASAGEIAFGALTGAALAGGALGVQAAFARIPGSPASFVSNGVSLDTNVIVSATQYGKAAAVDAALGGRQPVVTSTALDEFLAGGGAQADVDAFLSARGGGYGPAASDAARQELLDRLATHNNGLLAGQQRVLGPGDLCVAAEACQLGIPVLTQDSRFFKTMTALGIDAEKFG
ncbi:beta-1,3-glucanase family protein [Cellulomonas chitinilytica]|nr:beta-1,3-glucanase family protein [Cellulomonas chitinilytica]